MAANLFEKAKNTEVAKPKSKGKAKPQFEVEDLHNYAAVVAARKTLETIEATYKASINAEALAIFVKKGTSESVGGVDGSTTGSLQLRKRSGRSALSSQEQIVLGDLNISTELSSTSMFYINKKYAEDAELLGKVSDALDGVVPEDFLGHTGEKFVTTANSMNEAFQNCKGDQLADVLKIVGTQASRTKFGGDHAEMIAVLDGLLKG